MSNSGAIFRAPDGTLVTVLAQDTGTSDGQGHQLYNLSVSHGYQLASPNAQVTTSAFVDIAGSIIDSIGNTVVSYTLLNQDGANGISWQVLASNDPAFAASVVAQSSANIAAGGVGTYTTNPALYRYYKVQEKDQVGGSHASGLLRAIARG